MENRDMTSDITLTNGGKYMIQDNNNEVDRFTTPNGEVIDYNFISGISDAKENYHMNQETTFIENENMSDYDQSSIKYMNGFMRSQIGRNVVVEMLIGTSNMVMRSGILSAVGNNYFILHDADSRVYSAYSFYEVKSIHVPYIKDQA